MNCKLCPRNCNVDRQLNSGFCSVGDVMLISRIAPHMWEEPCISGDKGSGTIFFAGCNLGCRFCQNYDISVKAHGVPFAPQQLADAMLKLQDDGVANVNLVTPSHFVTQVAQALSTAKPKLRIPVVYNTSAYENVSSIRMLDGLVDVYLPDLKFCSPAVSNALANAPNYFEVATQAILEMRRQQPQMVFNNTGYAVKGVILRHLVLPSFVEDSKLVLDWIAQTDKDAWVSLMSQYFVARHDDKYPQLNRKLYKWEYDNVKQYFFNVGLHNGYFQDQASATMDYLPTFDDDQVQKFASDLPKRN